jgi:hypothetical protein
MSTATHDGPKHVVLFKFSPTSKKYERFDALVLQSRKFEENDHHTLNLIYFDHLNTAAHHALNGVNWADTIERMLDVPHEDDLENQSFYWVESEADELKAENAQLQHQLQAEQSLSDELRKKFSETTEGRDAALQAEADAFASLPGGASIPGVITETKHYSDGSSATGPAPLPDLSPDQQAAAEQGEQNTNESSD